MFLTIVVTVDDTTNTEPLVGRTDNILNGREKG